MRIVMIAALYLCLAPQITGGQVTHSVRHVVLQEQGTGDRVRPPFVIRSAPWFVSWRFDCSRVAAGQRHTSMNVSDAGSPVAVVVSDGQKESAVVLSPFRHPSDLDRLVKQSWRRGTTGTLSIDEPGQLFTIVISTRCSWSLQVTESPPGHDPLAGSWRYLKTVSRRKVEALGVRFTAIHRRVRVSRAQAIRLYRAGLAETARRTYVHSSRVTIQEALLAQVHTTERLVDGCICWTLVRRVQRSAADLIFLDAQSGKIRGEGTFTL